MARSHPVVRDRVRPREAAPCPADQHAPQARSLRGRRLALHARNPEVQPICEACEAIARAWRWIIEEAEASPWRVALEGDEGRAGRRRATFRWPGAS